MEPALLSMSLIHRPGPGDWVTHLLPRASVRKAPWATRDRLMGRVGGACYLPLENICFFDICHRRLSQVPNSQYLDGPVETHWKGHCDFWGKRMLGTAGGVPRASPFYIQGKTEATLWVGWSLVPVNLRGVFTLYMYQFWSNNCTGVAFRLLSITNLFFQWEHFAVQRNPAAGDLPDVCQLTLLTTVITGSKNRYTT